MSSIIYRLVQYLLFWILTWYLHDRWSKLMRNRKKVSTAYSFTNQIWTVLSQQILKFLHNQKCVCFQRDFMAAYTNYTDTPISWDRSCKHFRWLASERTIISSSGSSEIKRIEPLSFFFTKEPVVPNVFINLHLEGTEPWGNRLLNLLQFLYAFFLR